MIALRHIRRDGQVIHTANDEQAIQLFDMAAIGDTLHQVTPTDDPINLLNQIDSSLRDGKYKVL